MNMHEHLLQQLLALPSAEEPQLSPDRRWVAFVWYRVSRHADIFVAPADGSAPPLALTCTPQETQLIGWAADSTAVIVAEDHEGDERVRLFRVALAAPGVLEPLTEDRPPYFLRGGALSPDGRTLYYSMNYDAAQGALTDASWLYRHDLLSGERTPLAQARRASWAAPLLNSAGTHLLQLRVDRRPGGEQIHLVDVEGGADPEILNAGDARKVRAEWLPDGRGVLFVAETPDAAYQRVGLYDSVTGASRLLVDDPARLIETARATRDGLIVLDEVRGARHYASAIDPASGVETPFPPVEGNLLPLGRAADGAWLALHYTSTSPQDLVRLEVDPSGDPPPWAHDGGRPAPDDRSGGIDPAPGARRPPSLVSLTRWRERADLDISRLIPAEDFRWRAPDGLEVQGWLYRAQPSRGRAILYIHGGPTWHSEEWLNPQIQYLAACGFHVLDVNYRGSTGFGLAYRETIKADGWGGREQQDIAAGAQALIAAGLAEPGRVGVTGTSYGGYSAWCQIVHTPADLVAAAAPICGMTDLVVDYETTRPDLRPYSEEMIGGAPAEAPDRYRERSPIHFVQQIRGKLLIIQGAQDPNVTPENVLQVVQRLDAAGVPYELLEFADEGHGIHRPANQAVLYQRLAAFFDGALG